MAANPDFDATRDDESAYDLAPLGPETTGLPFIVWVAKDSGVELDVHVKVSKGVKVRRSDLISVAIRPDVRVVSGGLLSAQEVSVLKRWLDLNRDALIRYWDGDIEDTPEIVAALKRVEAA